jgi:hypothetical protein
MIPTAKQRVIVDPPDLDVYTDLGEKLYEVRCKRDAVSLHHESLKRNSDVFNKSIIILSLVVAFVETLKSTLDLTNRASYGYNISSCAKIAPIAISTLTAIISSLMKFKKFPERMEQLTKSTEKFNHTITKMRRLQEELNFVDVKVAEKVYIDEVMEFYRDSLQEAEASIYPDVRQKYFRKAQDNIIKMSKNEIKFQKTCKKLNFELEEMRRGGDEALRNFKIETPERNKRRKSFAQGLGSVFSSGDLQDNDVELLTVNDILPVRIPSLSSTTHLPVDEPETKPLTDVEPLPLTDAEPLPLTDVEPLPLTDAEPLPLTDAEPLPLTDAEPLPDAVSLEINDDANDTVLEVNDDANDTVLEVNDDADNVI